MGNSIDRSTATYLQQVAFRMNLTDQEIAAIEGAFLQRFRKRYITRQQFMIMYAELHPEVIRDPVLHNALRLICDSKERIYYYRILYTLGICQYGTEEEKRDWLFKLHDIDGDGTVDKFEMLSILRAAYMLKEGQKITGEFSSSISSLEERMRDTFRQCDQNYDGVLNPEEFMLACQINEDICQTIFTHIISTMNEMLQAIKVPKNSQTSGNEKQLKVV